MKHIKLNAILVFVLFFFSLINLPVNNISTDNAASDKDRIHLKSDSLIQGYPCISWVHFYANGKLKQFNLAHDYVIKNVIFPRNTTVFLDKNGGLFQVYLSKDTEIHSYTCPGGNMKEATGFYPSGKLRFFFPRKDLLINGYPVKGGSMKGVWFYESGKLKKFYLTKDYFINGKQYKKGDLVEI
jgi:hypothetical protein